MKTKMKPAVQVLLLLISFVFISCSGKKELRPDVFDTEKSFARANEYFEKREYDEARKLFFEVKNRDLTKKFAQVAQIKIADSYLKEEDMDRAIEEYKNFIDMYPDSKYAPYAQYQTAMMFFSQIEDSERGYGAALRALEEFERLEEMYPRNPYREVIPLRMEKCKTTIADYEFVVGEFYFKKGSYDAALNRLLELLSDFPEYKREPDVLYNIAMSYKHLNNKDKAQEYFKRLIEKYPNNKLVKQAQKELAAIK